MWCPSLLSWIYIQTSYFFFLVANRKLVQVFTVPKLTKPCHLQTEVVIRSWICSSQTSWCKMILWSVHFHNIMLTCSLNPVFIRLPTPPSSSAMELIHTCVYVLKSMCVYVFLNLCVTTVRSSFRMIIFLIQGLRRWDWTPASTCCAFIRLSAHSSHCVLQVLERGGPYPQVILPEFGGYWIEDPEAPPPTPPPTSTEIKEGEKNEGGLRREDEQLAGDYGYQLEEISEATRAYRKHFLGRVRLKWKLTGSRLWSCQLYLMLPICLFSVPENQLNASVKLN